jgi:hypothetical protein|tara:strand:- start:147 stop:449 length:303 start_codon:yes stop_codon:yes gene_type:complete
MNKYNPDLYDKSYCSIWENDVYECYFPKERDYWNGWSCPAFLTRESFLRYTKNIFSDYDLLQDEDFIIEYLTSIEEHLLGDEVVYSIMDGLCWNEVKKND